MLKGITAAELAQKMDKDYATAMRLELHELSSSGAPTSVELEQSVVLLHRRHERLLTRIVSGNVSHRFIAFLTV